MSLGTWFPRERPEDFPRWNDPTEQRPEPTHECCPKCGSEELRTVEYIVSFHLQCAACLWYGSDRQLVDHDGKLLRKRTLGAIRPAWISEEEWEKEA